MFVLILTILAHGYGISTTTTTGFTSKKACMAAGRTVELDIASRRNENFKTPPSKWEQLTLKPRAERQSVSIYYQCPEQ